MLDLFKRKRNKASRETANDRLRLVLSQDRASLSPRTLDALRADIVAVISKYVEIDEGSMEVEMQSSAGGYSLTASIPVRRLRRPPF